MKNDIWAMTQPAPNLEKELSRSPLLDVKVMMVDDEPLMTDLIQTHLEEEGYVNFVVSNNPLEALAMLRREEPGVLLLDLMMPQVSGFELLEAIRSDHQLRYTPVIVLTASTGSESKLRALQLGATDFLAKPVDASELVLRVRNTLAFHQYHNRLINFDPVTDLPNARLFDRGIDQMLQRRELVGGMVALLSITVPECQQLRETIDQATADNLVRALARRLTRFANDAGAVTPMATSVERSPRVARLGGDQFAVLLEGLADAEAVEALAKQALGLLSEPVSLGLHEVVPSAWIGIAVVPGDGDSAEAMRQGADLAVSHARREAAAQFKFASPELNARSYERLTLGLQLRGAAPRGELRLYYQPKLEVASNRIVGVEALVRWQHPERGLLPPVEFIPLAEELGLVGAIGQWVIERACHDVAVWSRAGLTPLKVAINVAERQFVSGDLCGILRRALFDSGLPASQVVIEVTESILMGDVQTALEVMRDLKDLGVTLSIDDFGTGYSSLSYLRRFPLDELKIDRSFLTDVPAQKVDVDIVRTVIGLGHSLGMTVTAEGVEVPAQLACLQQLGCDHYQGFLFAKALPTEQFFKLWSQGAAT